MFQVLPGDPTAAKGSGSIGPLNMLPLRNITPLSVLLCHNLAGPKPGQAKPLLSRKKSYLYLNSSANPSTRSQRLSLLPGTGASGDGRLSLGAGAMHGDDAGGASTHRGTRIPGGCGRAEWETAARAHGKGKGSLGSGDREHPSGQRRGEGGQRKPDRANAGITGCQGSCSQTRRGQSSLPARGVMSN